MAKALSKYIKDGSKSKETCSECGQETIIYVEGCKKCTNCGESKCG